MEKEKFFLVTEIFIYMEPRICVCCGRSKPLTSFYKMRGARDGYNRRCKICMSQYYKKYREEKKENPAPFNPHTGLKLTNTRKSDFCEMYSFLEKIGYDLTRDIHIQFCEKHNLPPKKRPSKSQNHYGPNDCI